MLRGTKENSSQSGVLQEAKIKQFDLVDRTCHVVAEQAVLLSLDGFLVVVDGLAVLVGLLQSLTHLGRQLRIPVNTSIRNYCGF